jgi:ribonuclease HI
MSTHPVDQIQEIAAAIARLKPEEKEHLFQLLADRGELPAGLVASSPQGMQLELLSSSPANDLAPDYVLTFDGGSKGNPGWGYGSFAITRVKDGAQRLERLDFGDGYTNNEAEYDALIHALRHLIGRIEDADHQPEEYALEIRGDSALVISQIQGKWKAKEPRMRERRDRCLQLLRRFKAVALKSQPREESVRILGH